MSTRNEQPRRTAAQTLAIESDATNILVIAGPGSGKTSTFVARIERLLQNGADPRRIAAISFTNAAAKEIEHRLERVVFDGVRIDSKTLDVRDVKETVRPKLGYCGTLHGFALRCLKKYGAAFGYGDRIAVVPPEGSEALIESKNRQIANGKFAIKALLKHKALGRPRESKSLIDLVVTAYFDELREAGLVDYDVLLTEFFRLLTAPANCGGDPIASSVARGVREEFDHLFVDEVQDSALVDWAIYRWLEIPNKFLVGDPDQSIYSFRGAALGEMLDTSVAPDWTVIRLEENFRSLTRICETAQRLIERNAGRVQKKTISAVGVGGLVWKRELENEGIEVAEIASQIRMELGAARKPEGIAVLTRSNAIAGEISKGLAAAGIPVAERVDPNLPTDVGFIRSLVTYLCNPDNDTLGYLFAIQRGLKIGIPPAIAKKQAHELRTQAATERRSMNSIAYGFPKKIALASSQLPEILGAAQVSAEGAMFVAEKLRELPDGAHLVELAHSLGNVHDASEKALAGEGVKVLTIHSAKGREFDVVFLAGFEDEAIPGRRADVDVEEERRLAYVGITRAKRAVHFTWAKVRETKWNGLERRTPSRFIEEAKP